MSTKYRVTIAGKEYELTYRLRPERQDIEAQAGMGMWECLKSNVADHSAALVWGGIKAKAGEELTVADVMDRLSAHVEDGGDLGVILRTVRRAALESGAMGRFEQKIVDALAPAVKDTAAIVPQ